MAPLQGKATSNSPVTRATEAGRRGEAALVGRADLAGRGPWRHGEWRRLFNCTLSGAAKCGVIIYQSSSGDAGPGYSIEASKNLVDWRVVFTTNPPAMPFHWSDTTATNQIAFYRALRKL